jgi:hypothetical protein
MEEQPEASQTSSIASNPTESNPMESSLTESSLTESNLIQTEYVFFSAEAAQARLNSLPNGLGPQLQSMVNQYGSSFIVRDFILCFFRILFPNGKPRQPNEYWFHAICYEKIAKHMGVEFGINVSTFNLTDCIIAIETNMNKYIDSLIRVETREFDKLYQNILTALQILSDVLQITAEPKYKSVVAVIKELKGQLSDDLMPGKPKIMMGKKNKVKGKKQAKANQNSMLPEPLINRTNDPIDDSTDNPNNPPDSFDVDKQPDQQDMVRHSSLGELSSEEPNTNSGQSNNYPRYQDDSNFHSRGFNPNRGRPQYANPYLNNNTNQPQYSNQPHQYNNNPYGPHNRPQRPMYANPDLSSMDQRPGRPQKGTFGPKSKPKKSKEKYAPKNKNKNIQ